MAAAGGAVVADDSPAALQLPGGWNVRDLPGLAGNGRRILIALQQGSGTAIGTSGHVGTQRAARRDQSNPQGQKTHLENSPSPFWRHSEV